METKELANALRRHSTYFPPGPDCLGCGYEHSCSTRGCKILRLAADELERLQAVAMDPDSVSRAEKQAVFRLGQKDMQQSVLLMLQDLSKHTIGVVKGAVEDVSAMIEDMLPEENTA